jgi:hypothetical protein
MNHFVHLHGSQENKHPSAEDEKNDRGFALERCWTTAWLCGTLMVSWRLLDD